MRFPFDIPVPPPPFRYNRVLLLTVAFHFVLLPELAPAQSHYNDCASETGNNATIILPDTSSIVFGDRLIQQGDEIAVFDAEGYCVGTARWTGEHISLTVWGTDEVTSEKDGLEMGETMHFRLWSAAEQQEWGGPDDFSVQFADHKPYLATENAYGPDYIYLLDSLHFEQPKQASR